MWLLANFKNRKFAGNSKEVKQLSIAKQLLVHILLFSSIATLLLTSIQLYTDYQKDVNAFNERFTHIEQGFQASLTQSLWTVNKDLMLLQLQGIRKFAGIEQVQILTPEGDVFIEVGSPPDANAIVHRTPLIYSDSTIFNHLLGTMVITGTLKGIHKRLLERTTTIMITQALKTFMVATFILWLVYYLITRHLLRIAEYIHLHSPTSPDRLPLLKLDRQYRRDELTLLVSKINESQQHIQDSYRLLQEREQSLEKAIKLQNEAERRANYEKARALATLSLIDDAILVTDCNANIALINDKTKQLFDDHRGELVGQNIQVIAQYLKLGQCPVKLNDLAMNPQIGYQNTELVRKKQHENIPVSISLRPILSESQTTPANCVLIICDLRQEQMTQKMWYLSTHDYLTNLPNRYAFEQAINNIPKDLRHYQYIALGIFDLDNFKIVNDTCGHQAGDALLSQLTTILNAQLPRYAKLYRLGGDEFGLLAGVDQIELLETLTNNCLKTVANYEFIWKHSHHQLTTSIGVSILQKNVSNTHDLMVDADEACYQAKARGGNRVIIQYAEDTARHANDIRSINKLQQLLRQPDLRLFAQPIIPLNDRTEFKPKLEMLLRHTDQHGKIYTPLAMIETGEKYGLIAPLDYWVLQETLRYADQLIRLGWNININVSPQTLTNDRYLKLLKHHLSHSGWLPGSLCLELTERSIVSNISQTRSIMQSLHKMGLTFAIDDFGAGFASYGLIRHLPISLIKIDGELVEKIDQDNGILTMVSSMIVMAESMAIPVAAEYVKTQSTANILRDINISFIQGELTGLAQPIAAYLQEAGQKAQDCTQ